MNDRRLARIADGMREPDFVRRIANLRAATARAGSVAPSTAAVILDLPRPIVDLICAWQAAAAIEGQAHHMAARINVICEGRRQPHG
ncbi:MULTISPECIES: hypothetical protein [unclassified Mesorhizobium]|uniref:hypothetical protein n=1 Tax=unclassified Mesorhizobium TaxID=325217 RepID=UPI000FCC23B3|nr:MULTISPECIES: hypothetical protein [unclassified Mesorhizobium]TGP24993.1 hypothetical protein EN874_007715 [Mesorhizobium sp. M1D.F.Ca.ET.231.01.1.1]TGP36317.1 hypothetical protein EN877_07715 [Mesorhizobium sp. M1D.F.Ca.ET.234.01.1.1]TGS49820.1 hypothetical protein EN827_07715 [Mesorhizobium sp. M1D.F.Ca.ET.184.01.1.1]TGS64531.1 hypothetical protein EN826_007715 [Mesorhizobium sp. M1D.F.Ca.ET.183.01.1.1]